MKEIKGFLESEYRKKALFVSRDCVGPDELCDYINGLLPLRKRELIESHLAGCYHCLDMIVSIHNSERFCNYKDNSFIRRLKMRREYLFLVLAIIFFISSFIFRGYFLQFLAATIILGMKWIVDTKNTRMLVMIYEAWKKGGEREAGRVLKELEIKDRIGHEKFL